MARPTSCWMDGMSAANSSKPVVDFPNGEPPTVLEITDITVGDGAEAKPGGTVRVHYLGVEFASGEEFDSSWNRGESIEFPLRGLIKGWQDGIPGMKVGGRRQLTIPPELAYGPKRRRAPAERADADLRHRPAGRALARSPDPRAGVIRPVTSQQGNRARMARIPCSGGSRQGRWQVGNGKARLLLHAGGGPFVSGRGGLSTGSDPA